MPNLSCGEPTIEQLLDDPVILAVMRADRVDARALRRMLDSIALDLQSRAPSDNELTWQAAAFEHSNVAQWLPSPSCVGC